MPGEFVSLSDLKGYRDAPATPQKRPFRVHIVGPPSNDLSTFSEHEVFQRLYATQRVLGHVLGHFVNLAHCRVAAFDAPMRVDSFHVTGCLDVIALINIARNMALHGGGSAVTCVFASLGFTEVITSYANTNALSKAWKTEKKKCAVITAGVVRSEEGFIQSGSMSLHGG